jgi:hypothetical protein
MTAKNPLTCKKNPIKTATLKKKWTKTLQKLAQTQKSKKAYKKRLEKLLFHLNPNSNLQKATNKFTVNP